MRHVWRYALGALAAVFMLGAVPLQNAVVSVPNTAELRKLSTVAADGGTVLRITDGLAGAGPLPFFPGSGACPKDDGASCVNSADGNHWNGQFASTGADNREFGAVGDGITDNTTAMQNWLNYGLATAAQHGAVLSLAAGTYVVKQPLALNANVSNLSIKGAGRGASKIIYAGTSTTPDILVLGTGSALSTNLTLTDFTIDSNTTMTAGAALHIKNTSVIKMHGVDLATQYGTHNLWNGFFCESCAQAHIGAYDYYAQSDVVGIAGNSTFTGTTVANDDYFNEGKISGGAVGVHLGGGACGIQFLAGAGIIANTTNVVYDNAINSAMSNCQLRLGPGSSLDSAGTDNMVINQASCTGNGCQIMLGGWIATAPRYGVHVVTCGGCAIVVMDGPILGNAQDGFLFDDGTPTVSIDAQIFKNGATSGYGVACAGTSPTFQTLNVGRLYQNGPSTVGQVQSTCTLPFNWLTDNDGIVQNFRIRNNGTSSGTAANLTLSTGTANNWLGFSASTQAGGPLAKITSGSGNTGGLQLDPGVGHPLVFLNLSVTPGSKQPLCIDTVTNSVYRGNAGAC